MQADWNTLAALPGLRSVIDPRDTQGAKNELIHRVHLHALRTVFRQADVRRYGTALDFGCGVGRLTPALLDVADRVVGVDSSEGMLERAVASYGASRAEFVLPDAVPDLQGPLLVVAVYVLQLFDEPMVRSTLRDLHRRAGPDSQCIVIDRVISAADSVLDIEPRDVAWYVTALTEAGWNVRGERTIRRAWSIPMRVNGIVSTRVPEPVRRCSISLFAAAEFARAKRAHSGPYVDVCIWADA